ncbi:hypothetical protein Dimus_027024 [Dionaea muscipula]
MEHSRPRYCVPVGLQPMEMPQDLYEHEHCQLPACIQHTMQLPANTHGQQRLLDAGSLPPSPKKPAAVTYCVKASRLAADAGSTRDHQLQPKAASSGTAGSRRQRAAAPRAAEGSEQRKRRQPKAASSGTLPSELHRAPMYPAARQSISLAARGTPISLPCGQQHQAACSKFKLRATTFL